MEIPSGAGTTHIRNHFVRNSKECNFHKTVWCEGVLPLADTETNNVREDEFNSILGYAVSRIENLTEHAYKSCDRIQKSLNKNMLWMTQMDWVEYFTQWVWNDHMIWYFGGLEFRMMKLILKTVL